MSNADRIGASKIHLGLAPHVEKIFDNNLNFIIQFWCATLPLQNSNKMYYMAWHGKYLQIHGNEKSH